MLRSSLLLVLLAACNQTDKGGDVGDTGAVTTVSDDHDGDSFSSGEDCDDQDPLINPNAAEICDGVDNDCDGLIDEDDAIDGDTFYADEDGDGHGDPSAPMTACSAPDGYVDNADDCDDSDAGIHPGADEYCDGVDNNCDGDVDGEDALDPQTWYADTDSDGYGDPDLTQLACDQPSGYTDNADDCDDSSDQALPGGEEVCDGLDNDCDGDVDEDEASDATTWFNDADGDGYGDSTISTVACYAPTGFVSDGSDCDDRDGATWPGADEYCDGVDTDCDGDLDEDPSGSDPGALDAPVWYRDTDEDGYGGVLTTRSCEQPSGFVDNADDCDDTDDGVHPGADEYCNGDDDDCDGSVDEDDAVDASTWYTDDDGDGYGDAGSATLACDAPTGTVADDTDCDDTDRTIHPGATERCDGEDNDCDGTVDGAASVDATLWYADDDGDGYGDVTITIRDCTVPSGYVSDHSDCDDDDSTAYPGADEYCDEVDNDCDGVTDEPSAVDALEWTIDNDGDGYGATGGSTRTACSEPSGYSANDLDCDDTRASVNPGQTEVCTNGIDDDCDGTPDNDCPISHCGNISTDETWSSSDEHLVTCDITVSGSSRPVLTIEDGVEVQFQPGTGITVGSGAHGSLDVQGTSAGVVFTSSQSTPRLGDWDGLYFGYYDDHSQIEGLTVEYAGNNGYGGIFTYYSSPTILDSLIQYNSNNGVVVSTGATPEITGTIISDNEDDGLHVNAGGGLETSGGPTFVDNEVSANGGYPVVIPAAYADQLDASSTFSGNGDDVISVTAGVIDQDAAWQDLDVPYRACGDISVHGSARPEWTIEDGVELQMEYGTSIIIGSGSHGRLIVDGASAGVTITSAQSSPAAGDWNGILFHYYDDGSELTGATISYGGANGYGDAYVYYSDPVFEDCTFSYSTTSGVYVSTGSYPTISGCTVSDNDNNGVRVVGGGGLETAGGPNFVDNVITGNGDEPVVIPANYAGEIDSSCTLSGNDEDYVAISTDVVDTDQTWQALDVDWLVTGDVWVYGSGRPELTIEDGATFYMDSGTSVFVGTSSYGALLAQGSSSGVTFTSYRGSSGRAGDWNGLYFGYYDQGSELDGVSVLYSGGNGYGGIFTYYASPIITDCTVRYSTTDGIYVSSGSYPTISGCTLSDNDDQGITITSGGGLETSGGPTMTDMVITDNGDYPISIPAEYVGQLDASGSYSGNGDDWIHVQTGVVHSDATWQALDVNYLISGDVSVYGSGSPELNIERGATLEFESGAGLMVGTSSAGALVALGTSTDGVTFTSADSSPSAGDWDGILFGYYTDDADTELQYVTVEYGGGNGKGNVYYYYSDATLKDAIIQYSSHWGIYRQNSSPSLYNITYNSNADGTIY